MNDRELASYTLIHTDLPYIIVQESHAVSWSNSHFLSCQCIEDGSTCNRRKDSYEEVYRTKVC